MHYRAQSPDAPALLKENFEEAYVNPLSSVLADYVYNSLLTGRPYFLQMMDDLKIAELFIGSKSARSGLPVMIAAANDAYGLAIRFTEIDPKIRVLPNHNASPVDWPALVEKSQEEWPIAYLLPFGASYGAGKRASVFFSAHDGSLSAHGTSIDSHLEEFPRVD